MLMNEIIGFFIFWTAVLINFITAFVILNFNLCVRSSQVVVRNNLERRFKINEFLKEIFPQNFNDRKHLNKKNNSYFEFL